MNKTGKKWIAFNFIPDTKDASTKTASATKRLNLKESSFTKSKKSTLPIIRKRSFNFEQNLRPKAISELAVHPKKVKDVQSWLQDNVINKPKNRKTAAFLLITGPTGSGKSTTVKLLCESLSISITEWINPIDHDYDSYHSSNQITRFNEFLTESKWAPLSCGSKHKVILIEEFPNAIIREPGEFNNILETCYYESSYSVIFVCTDSFHSGNKVAQTLFPDEVMMKYSIAQISFNACATTLMKQALKRAFNLVQENKDLFKTPAANTVDAIIATSMGDLRCAINQYYFASLLGTADLPMITEKPTSRKRKRKDNVLSIKSMSRDETLGLFHGLGRVLNPKRIETQNSWKLDCDLDKLVDEFSTQPGIFTSFLFENYIRYFGDIQDVSKAADILSFSQIFLENWFDRHDTLIFALWVSVVGLMVCNEHKVSKWNQIRGPKKIKKRVNNDLATRHLSITDMFYYNMIKKPGENDLLRQKFENSNGNILACN